MKLFLVNSSKTKQGKMNKDCMIVYGSINNIGKQLKKIIIQKQFQKM